jgi:hypothetical protein
MNIEEITKAVKKELFKSFDKESIDMIDAFLISECIRETLIAINYTHCCTELREEYLQPELDKYKNIKVERTKGRSDM